HFEFRLERGDFDQARQIAAGPDGNGDVRHVHAEDLDEFLLDAKAINVRDFVPELQRDHQVHAFFGANAFDAEHGGDIDDADAADFHVVARQLRAHPHDIAAVHERDAGNVVGHETVTAFDEGEDALAFADAAFTADDDADAEDIDHAAHLGAA